MATKKKNYHSNYQQNEIQNAVDQNLASAPSSPKEGQFYWNTATKEDMIYNGTSWVSRTTQGKTYTQGDGITISGTTISNAGVRSVSTGATNGTISVNTGGTSAEVSVYGLGTAAYVNTTTSVSSGGTGALTAGGAYSNLVRRLSSSAATGSTSQGVYVDANGQVQTCDAVTSTYSNTGTAPVNGTAVASAISSALSSVYKPAGSVAFANRPSLSASIEGNVYNITDSFTTTSDFVEGAGKTYPAGTNIVCINTTGTTYKWDVLAGFVDLSGYQLSATAVTHTESTAAGSATQPVYVNSSGVATACSYELNKTVPSDAVFTDTDTKVTQNKSTTNATYPILLTPTADASTNQGEKTAIFAAGVKVNPSTSTITATTFSGNATSATTATKLGSSDVGSATQPIYLDDGVPTATTYSLNKTVPADAVFTDTTYSAFGGADGTSAGSAGLVPAPTATDNVKFLKGNGTWANAVENTATGTYSVTLVSPWSPCSYEQAVNIGYYSSISGNWGVAIGHDSHAAANGVAIGHGVTVGTQSVGLGCFASGGGSTALGTQCVHIGYGGSAANDSVSIGYYSYGSGSGVAIGNNTEISNSYTVAIGHYASCTKTRSIQIGSGTNTESYSCYIGFNGDTDSGYNYKILDYSGYIPNARLHLDTSPTSASGNAITSGAVYTALQSKTQKLVATNTALTATGGQCTWEITNTLATDECGVFVKEVSTNEYVDCYFEVTSSKVTIKINSSSNIAAGTYKAIIIG